MGIATSLVRASTAVCAVAVTLMVVSFGAPAVHAAPAGDAAQGQAKKGALAGTTLVRAVQQKLKENGYNPGPVDGVMGAMTRNSLYAYQRHHGLPVDGRINGPTLRSLGLK